MKTKISEYSTTNSSNTDIEGINIDEGCPPSSINNAIRELMVHLKEFQTGTSGDAFTFAGGTLMSGTNTISGAAVISGNINSSGTTNTFSGGNILSGTNTISGSAIISGNINSSGTTNTFSGGVVHSGNIDSSGTNTFSGSNVMSFSGGSSASPSIYFASDTNTGIFSPAADTIAFTNGGVESMRIASAGNVGIATTAPAAKLNVAGNTILSNVDMLNASYDSVSFSVAGEELTPAGLFFSPDGTRMYVIGFTGDDVNQYSLSTPWVVSSATFVTAFSIAGQETDPRGIFFRADGLKMYIVGRTNDTVYQYALTRPWTISTASYESISFSVTSQDTDPRGVFFKPDGLTMYIIGIANDDVYQYALSTAWNVSTATFTQAFSVSGQETTPQDFSFTGDGSRMFILGSSGDDVTVYNLTTPWDISTAATTGQFSISGQETNPEGFYVKPDGTKFYIVGTTNDTVYQYTIPSIEINLTGTTNINGGATVAQDLTVDGNLQALNVRSGTWTPTLTNTTNIAASTNAICQFTLVGNVVTFSGTCSIDPTATGSVVLGISLPVSSNFATAVQAGGTLNANNGSIVGAITSDSTNDRLTMTGNASGTANVSCSFSGSYLVV